MRVSGLLGRGLLAVVVAMVATASVAAVARAVGVDFEVPDGGAESIPVSGVAVVTGVFSVVGVVLAAGLLRWSARPAPRFLQTALPLAALSLVPPFLAGADGGTTASLVTLHLVAAAVMVPALTRTLRRA